MITVSTTPGADLWLEADDVIGLIDTVPSRATPASPPQLSTSGCARQPLGGSYQSPVTGRVADGRSGQARGGFAQSERLAAADSIPTSRVERLPQASLYARRSQRSAKATSPPRADKHDGVRYARPRIRRLGELSRRAQTPRQRRRPRWSARRSTRAARGRRIEVAQQHQWDRFQASLMTACTVAADRYASRTPGIDKIRSSAESGSATSISRICCPVTVLRISCGLP